MGRGIENIGARCAVVFESLEARELMSASLVKAAPKAATHPVAAVHAKPKAVKKPVKAKKAVKAVVTPAPLAWNDLVGTWTGTFTSLAGVAPRALSVTFQPRWNQSNTGTFNLSAMVGQSAALTTVTPDAQGNVLVQIPLKNGGSVCMVAGLSLDGKFMTGRWCSYVGTMYTTGIFQMTRP